jgi:Protein of unknown function (DUF3040)
VGLTDDEFRRLDAVARELERDDPGLARTLSNCPPRRGPRIGRNAPLAAPLPTTVRSIALLVCVVSGVHWRLRACRYNSRLCSRWVC